MSPAELEARVNFAGWPPCPRCKGDVGTIGYTHWGSIICATCSNDVRRKVDTRNEWWRSAPASSDGRLINDQKPKT